MRKPSRLDLSIILNDNKIVSVDVGSDGSDVLTHAVVLPPAISLGSEPVTDSIRAGEVRIDQSLVLFSDTLMHICPFILCHGLKASSK